MPQCLFDMLLGNRHVTDIVCMMLLMALGRALSPCLRQNQTLSTKQSYASAAAVLDEKLVCHE
jgi:hypothetical protein